MCPIPIHMHNGGLRCRQEHSFLRRSGVRTTDVPTSESQEQGNSELNFYWFGCLRLPRGSSLRIRCMQINGSLLHTGSLEATNNG